jgi:hypothetical protein
MAVTTTMRDWLSRLPPTEPAVAGDVLPREGGVKSVPATELSEVLIVAYQRFWLDYDLPDGTYTPEELRRARLLVKPGPVLRYRLRWPGGRPQPLAAQELIPAHQDNRTKTQMQVNP